MVGKAANASPSPSMLSKGFCLRVVKKLGLRGTELYLSKMTRIYTLSDSKDL